VSSCKTWLGLSVKVRQVLLLALGRLELEPLSFFPALPGLRLRVARKHFAASVPQKCRLSEKLQGQSFHLRRGCALFQLWDKGYAV
jgi:hypothetical protein